MSDYSSNEEGSPHTIEDTPDREERSPSPIRTRHSLFSNHKRVSSPQLDIPLLMDDSQLAKLASSSEVSLSQPTLSQPINVVTDSVIDSVPSVGGLPSTLFRPTIFDNEPIRPGSIATIGRPFRSSELEGMAADLTKVPYALRNTDIALVDWFRLVWPSLWERCRLIDCDHR